MTHRVAAGTLLAVLIVASGCVGMLSGPVTFSASKATVSDAALEETGFEHNRTDQMTATREFSAAGQSKEVEVTNWISEYHRNIGLSGAAEQEVAVFATFASPQVEVVGKSFNPLAKYENRQLAEQFTARLDSVENVRQVDSRQRSMLGRSTEVTKFEATVTTAAGVQFDAYLHVTKVEHDGDHVVALAVYPQQFGDRGETVAKLLDGVEHGE
jgi:outer membrane lipopolysaccharide assembly protein LptE/RlpB